MSKVISQLKRFLRDESGPTAVEYGVMLLLILLVCLGAIGYLGASTSDRFTNNSQSIQSAVTASSSGL